MLVVKIGGSQGVELDGVCTDIANLVSEGQPVVVVHGGSAETNEISEKLGFPPRFVTNQSGFTSRYTDRNTLEIFAMVTNGRINTLLVERLQKNNVNAIGLSGLDARLMVAKRKEAIRIIENGRQRMLRDDYTGKIETVNGDFLEMLVNSGLTPVISPLAMSTDGIALNVDADRAAAMVAGAVKASELIILTNVPGLMRNFPDESTVIPHIPRNGLEQALSLAEGRMKKKVLGASEALNLGVPKVIFADGRVEHPLKKALSGTGTVIS
ncbi:[LysW]-aminoadipate kinase [Leptolinea tardivitalis]|uniref:Putative [LysW]-aminoadipate kinase n=1 Tax=Leptolinea tardivitalis TaxID=229920 RepID=A0A0P6XL45_9CHLR|nr:[LysW]-aminoadipate kinase [Leptolinea tardivitalis]KPL72395.1 acetylglutamate kinase [Leptolinea tardivitalis]GAP22772.1 N-acetylglutamate kinase [Leptolinea tardivitalis]